LDEILTRELSEKDYEAAIRIVDKLVSTTNKFWKELHQFAVSKALESSQN
jgi:hypothetical protein